MNHRELSWGRVFDEPQTLHPLFWLPTKLPKKGPFLPYGLGRSYGDVCLHSHGTLLATQNLARLISFDKEKGILVAEAGISLGEILRLVLPHGWSLPVIPGTKHVSLGGAIANDVHGKNHHKVGTFGCHVRSFELLRSDGKPLSCSAKENTHLFEATIGGLGLTGLITWAEIQLIPIQAPAIEMEQIRFRNLEEYFLLSEQSDRDFDYTVAWVDSLARGTSLGRGILHRGRLAKEGGRSFQKRKSCLSVPIDAPRWILNSWTMSLFNKLYYHRQWRKRRKRISDFASFFFPLDQIAHWNRLYGRAGFFQYQCVLPQENAKALYEIFDLIASSRLGSFLGVLKTFGNNPSPGLLSFPMAGPTLCLDFPNRGEKTRKLFSKMDAIVGAHGGRLYPAKDARMSPEMFAAGYPQHRKFCEFVDPTFSSNFWRRVTKR